MYEWGYDPKKKSNPVLTQEDSSVCQITPLDQDPHCLVGTQPSPQ